MIQDTPRVQKLINNFNIDYKAKGGWTVFERKALDVNIKAAAIEFGFSPQYGSYIFKQIHGESLESYKAALQASVADKTDAR